MHLGPTERVQIAKALGDDVSFVRDIRLVTRKGLWTCSSRVILTPLVCVSGPTGSSSFAFVEFYDAKDSARWMEKIEVQYQNLPLCGFVPHMKKHVYSILAKREEKKSLPHHN